MPLSRYIQDVLALLRDYTTMDRVQRFLAERKIPRSAASWKELIDDRITPAFDKGSISREDLINLLRESEEHGHQHVFLYRTTKTASLLNATRIAGELKKRGQENILKEPRILNRPASATMVDARREAFPGGDESFTLKAIETRVYQKRTSQRVTNKQIIIDFEPVESRAVNLFRLKSDGLLELRIQSYTNTSQYDDAVESMWNISGEILPRDSFQQISLQKAKENLLRNREQLKDGIRHSDSTVRNDAGIMLRITTGETADDLYADKAANRSLGDFLDTRAFGERLNVYFLHHDGVPLPTQETHTILAGSINEFAILGACPKEDYEYVLGQLIKYNQ